MSPAGAELAFMQTFVPLLLLGAGLAYLCHRLKLPSVLGFILTGALAGPGGFSLVTSARDIGLLSHLGVIFLLFVVGLEMSPDFLRQMRGQALLTGLLQLTLCGAGLSTLFFLAGAPLQLALVLGGIASLSSTAIVLKTLEELGESDSPQGRLMLGVLIVQDLAIVPMMALLPTLGQPVSGGAAEIAQAVGLEIVKAMVALAAAVWVSLKLAPMALERVASINNRELFTLAVVGLGLGVALMAGGMGLSFEAGAFIAGLSLSGSLFSQQIVADSRPFRDVLTTVFFVSIGLMLDVPFLMSHWAAVLPLTALLLLVKAALTGGAVRIMGFSKRKSLWCGLSLFQIGELSFVLLQRLQLQATETQAGSAFHEALLWWTPLLVNAIVLSMLLTPLLMRRLPAWLSPKRFSASDVDMPLRALPASPELANARKRALIAGYGPIGRRVAAILRHQNVACTVIEMNAQTVKRLTAQGIAAVYGDASHPDVLEAAGVSESHLIALTYPDVRNVELALQQARRINPHIHVIARSRYAPPLERLRQLGADAVVYEEFESSLSFVFLSLTALGFSREIAASVLTRLRQGQDAHLLDSFEDGPSVAQRLSIFADARIEWLTIAPESPLSGQTLADSALRTRTGANVLALLSADGGKTPQTPDPQTRLNAGDILVAMGAPDQLKSLEALADPAQQQPDPPGTSV